MRFKTETGSTYEIRGDEIRRLNPDYTKRADGEWVRLLNSPKVEVGYRVLLELEPLHEYGEDDSGVDSQGVVPDVTIRTTSRVTEVWA